MALPDPMINLQDLTYTTKGPQKSWAFWLGTFVRCVQKAPERKLFFSQGLLIATYKLLFRFLRFKTNGVGTFRLNAQCPGRVSALRNRMQQPCA
jgi:hypothetical protein